MSLKAVWMGNSQFDIYHIDIVRENYNVKVFAQYGHSAGITVIITETYIFHVSQNLFDTAVTLKYGHIDWKWCEQIKLREQYHAQFDMYHIRCVCENVCVKVLDKSTHLTIQKCVISFVYTLKPQKSYIAWSFFQCIYKTCKNLKSTIWSLCFWHTYILKQGQGSSNLERQCRFPARL